MSFLLSINKKKGWKLIRLKNKKLFVKGYLNNLSFDELIQKVNNCAFNIKKLIEFFKKLDGHYSIIFLDKDKCLICVDRISSIPLLIKYSETKFIIADCFENLVKSLKKNDKTLNIDQLQAKHLAMTGYTFGKGSLYKNILLSQTGSMYILNKKNIKNFKYHTWAPYKKIKNSNLKLKIKLKTINDNVINKLIVSSDNRCIVIPLSAGYDSRFILSGLIQKGYKNIVTFSYGASKNREAKVAKSISNYLRVPWFYIKYDNNNQKIVMKSKLYEDYKKFSDTTSSVHFPQDFQAIYQLKKEKKIPHDSIIVNGQTGDFISGNHILKSSENNFDNVLNLYYLKHYKIWNSLVKKNKKLMISLLKGRIASLKLKKIENNLLLELLQRFEYEDRQAKYVMGGQRIYEFLGFDWRLPLWDLEYINFWENTEVKYKINQSLYKEVLLEQNWANVWRGFPINPKNSYSLNIFLIRFLFKCLFSILGKDKWHKFELRFLDYFMAPLCGYAPWKYKKIIADNRGYSGPLSWHIEEYLNKKNINWNGECFK